MEHKKYVSLQADDEETLSVATEREDAQRLAEVYTLEQCFFQLMPCFVPQYNFTMNRLPFQQSNTGNVSDEEEEEE